MSEQIGMADQQLMSLKPGTVISGRYEVVRCLGAGSMGLVYACRHRELAGQLVAVKVLFPEVAQDKVAAARFRNEIQASYGVSHPNVVRAYEFIRDGEMLAYTMEFVGGGDVAEKLSDPSKLMGIDEILSIVSQMCLGVQAIHDAGIVHRDLKPENILLSKEGQVKIADFGIAKAGSGPRLTEHGGVVGTIDYVSPEYMLNAQVDWRSDIYAMGVLLYEMLTGTSPFKADSVYATMTKRLKTDPTPPSKLRRDCPEDLDRVVARAMQRNPELRYQAAMEMGQDLMQVAEVMGLASRIQGTKSGMSRIPSRPSVQPTPSGSNLQRGDTGLGQPRPSPRIPDNDLPRDPMRTERVESPPPPRPPPQQPAMASRETTKMGSGSLLAPSSSDKTVLVDTSSRQMEAVLSGKVSVFDTWDTSKKIRPAKVNRASQPGGGSNDLRDLTRKAGKSIWPDILTLVVAIGVGVTVGLIVLKLFAFQFFGTK